MLVGCWLFQFWSLSPSFVWKLTLWLNSSLSHCNGVWLNDLSWPRTWVYQRQRAVHLVCIIWRLLAPINTLLHLDFSTSWSAALRDITQAMHQMRHAFSIFMLLLFILRPLLKQNKRFSNSRSFQNFPAANIWGTVLFYRRNLSNISVVDWVSFIVDRYFPVWNGSILVFNFDWVNLRRGCVSIFLVVQLLLYYLVDSPGCSLCRCIWRSFILHTCVLLLAIPSFHLDRWLWDWLLGYLGGLHACILARMNFWLRWRNWVVFQTNLRFQVSWVFIHIFYN